MSVRRAIQQAELLLPGTQAPEGKPDRRWQAIIRVGEYVESNPEEVWQFVRRWGVHRQVDLRQAIAGCLLEHLLEHHFSLICPRVENAIRQSKRFADTFTRCWKFGQAELPENAMEFDRLQTLCRKCPAGKDS